MANIQMQRTWQKRHAFCRTQLSARDFQNEYHFAQYCADLVKARGENT